MKIQEGERERKEEGRKKRKKENEAWKRIDMEGEGEIGMYTGRETKVGRNVECKQAGG